MLVQFSVLPMDFSPTLSHPMQLRQGFLAIVMDHAACGDLLGRVDAVKKSERSEHRYLQEECQ